MKSGRELTAVSLKRSHRQKPIYTQVVELIQGSIWNGELVPGDQLLPERELAEKFGVSRPSVRQALAVLENMGIIKISPRDGAYVRRQSLENAIEPLAHVLFQEREQVAHLFEVRQIIETQAVRLAALRRDEADLRNLRTLNRQFEADLQQGDVAFEANKGFHIAIVETAKNPLLNEIMATILAASMEVYTSIRRQSLSNSRNLLRFVAEHDQIVDAIEQHNAQLAVTLLNRHIEDARHRVEEIMNEAK